MKGEVTFNHNSPHASSHNPISNVWRHFIKDRGFMLTKAIIFQRILVGLKKGEKINSKIKKKKKKKKK